MSNGLKILKCLLDELKTEAKQYKIKVSQKCFGMYKKEPSFFWRAVIRQDYSYTGEGLLYLVAVSVVPPQFDEIRFMITNPGEGIQFTDVLRANRGFAFFTISERKYLYSDSENLDQKETLRKLAGTIIDSVRFDISAFREKIHTEYGDLFHYLLSQREAEPILAGLAHIHLQDYIQAIECFDLAEREGKYWRLCYGTLDRFFHHVCRDYCIAILQGIPWEKSYVTCFPPFSSDRWTN